MPTRFPTLPLLALLAACGMSSSAFSATPRPVDGLPSAFAVDTAFHTTVRTPPAGACLTHLVDPRDGTSLVLDEAQGGVGHFRVTPAGRYGLAPDELLRVDCATGTPRGAVRK